MSQYQMLRFAEVFPGVEIVSAAQRQLSWTRARLENREEDQEKGANR